jgi:uracil-DNA glycosylase family 4
MDQDEVQGCTRCVLHQARTQTVFGEGNPTADVMFIGEGPGETEDRMGRPFVGPAGELLNKMIVAMGLSREEVYIANTVKCRPPGNRVPTPEECMTCGDYLTRQIAIIRPKVIVTLGGPATKYILDTQTGITALRGRWHAYDVLPDQDPIPVMPTFHPAYVLRNYTTDVRKKVWTDLQDVMKKIKAD